MNDERKLDVLEVMRSLRAKSLDHLSPDEFQEATEARAAVAELIAAAKELCDFPYDDPPQGRLWTALARCGGA